MLVLVVFVLAIAAGADSQQAPAPAPAAGGCTILLAKAADCLQYITPGSPLNQPPEKCCTEVNSGVEDPAAVACVCGLLGGHTFGLPLNLTRAAGLPVACGAPASSLGQCNGWYPTISSLFLFLINNLSCIHVTDISLKLHLLVSWSVTNIADLTATSSSPAAPTHGGKGGAKSAATRSRITAVLLVASLLISGYHF
ncbi:hypothetical protein BAE44_0018969 [Dichanthelium oligosanthes]|uniref:Bifunctional inhibitor/plant lipid transfer protein/seed storage helical domain-containing protein n=1 Tax=Dichanthelium oligosanthes TaxID=888268 RepID=A0A1E5V4U7_9POAL|nr:hypothetical protein BAE44_0018969 [Dichanthelium oligosanthes]